MSAAVDPVEESVEEPAPAEPAPPADSAPVDEPTPEPAPAEPTPEPAGEQTPAPTPTPQAGDPWEPCTFDDLRLRDRLRCQWIHRGRLLAREGTVAGFSTLVGTDPQSTTTAVLDTEGLVIVTRREAESSAVLTRIPAPVQPVDYATLPALFGEILTDIRGVDGRTHTSAVWNGFHWSTEGGEALNATDISAATHQNHRLTHDGETEIGQPRFRKEPLT